MAAEAHLNVTHLQWGVKQSFRGYVEGAGGTITIAGGTERTPDGSFTFPVDEAVLSLNAEGKLEGRATFKGEVSFKAHGGMLNVFLAEPILEITAGEAKLTVADTLSRKYRTEVARLDLVGMSQDEAGNLTCLWTAFSGWVTTIRSEHPWTRQPWWSFRPAGGHLPGIHRPRDLTPCQGSRAV